MPCEGVEAVVVWPQRDQRPKPSNLSAQVWQQCRSKITLCKRDPLIAPELQQGALDLSTLNTKAWPPPT